MGDNIYTQVKAAVTPKQAVERLGFEIIDDKIKSPWNANDQNRVAICIITISAITATNVSGMMLLT